MFTVPVYIESILGKMDRDSIDIRNLYNDSSKNSPILFILSSGVDIMQNFREIAKEFENVRGNL